MSKTNPNEEAFPIPAVADSMGSITYSAVNGLTKREYFAAHAPIQSFINTYMDHPDFGDIAKFAVSYADELIEELNKEKS